MRIVINVYYRCNLKQIVITIPSLTMTVFAETDNFKSSVYLIATHGYRISFAIENL